MGRSLLTALLLVLAAACGGGPQDALEPTSTDETSAAQARAADPHADVSCAGCHRGTALSGRLGAVPREACATSGCHTDDGPAQVTVANATFHHRDHGRTTDIQPTCAGCHTHESGEEPLVASVDACALCHISAVSGTDELACRTCHVSPDHTALTSQAVPVAHSMLPSLEAGCVRCHYDVAEATTVVQPERCASCHANAQQVIARGTGVDMHPSHGGVSCTSCHEAGMHQVRAMSSAVALVCVDCHTTAHDVAAADFPSSMTCTSCHANEHFAQQQLLLGMLPTGDGAPSVKFIAGVTCRSCHIPEGAPETGEPIRGTAQACASCHPNEYERVLDWWLAGARQRAARARSYLDTAMRELTTSDDSVQTLLARSNRMLSLVEEAGAQHNLELSDRIVHDVVQNAASAYRLARHRAPPRPELGTSAHVGTCTYCHYRTDGPLDYRSMPEDFHRRVLGVEEQR